MPDNWTGVANGQTEFRLDLHKQQIGIIIYIETTGEIRKIWINSNYDEKILGKMLIKEAIIDMRKAGADICWIASSKSNNFFQNISGNKFLYSELLNKKISKSGYFLNL